MMHWAGRIEKELDKVLQLVTGTQQMRSVSDVSAGSAAPCLPALLISQLSLGKSVCVCVWA